MTIDLKIINNSGLKKILIVGVFHGDEPQGELFINKYLEKEYKDSKNELYFIPRLNKNNKRTNANGVDLNRNFPTKNWQKSARVDYFGGDITKSEEETKFLVNLIEDNSFDAIVTIHAPYKIINYDGPALELAQKISLILNYPVESDIGYPTPGSFGTYCGVERQIPVITIEIDENKAPEELLERFIKLFDYLRCEY